ncbi:diguanylate cyclase domain-containing protein [Adlercreutzia sp. ZJ305]|uniref:diguanylate cyclase domain-containing protein n=2 Tax=unclassified Adlercreutzia TaxID=2636013 RepID=UPI0013EBA190|nr:diguanylate cyclase [Adlercreutzia sp. ZJ305]
MSRTEALRSLDRIMVIMVGASLVACLLLVLVTFRSAKQTNDKFGHPEGDMALRSFARQLDEALYEAKRKGKDRFLIANRAS